MELHQKLIQILGSNNVYFQPPATVKMQYPCIVYNRMAGDTNFADNIPYMFTQGYEVLLIYKDPDSPLVQKLATGFPMIRLNRHYVAENLNHEAYTLYY